MENTTAKKFKLIMTIIAISVLVILILLNVAMIISSYVDEDHMPSVFGVSPVIVLSGSMSPTFETGSLIFIKDVDTSTLEVGDVICYITNGVAVTHRISSVQSDGSERYYVTKGDANNTVDIAVVGESQIEGEYIGHIAGLGTLALFMQSTTGIIVCVAIPVLLYLIYDMTKRKKEAQKQQEKSKELEAQLAQLRGEEKE